MSSAESIVTKRVALAELRFLARKEPVNQLTQKAESKCSRLFALNPWISKGLQRFGRRGASFSSEPVALGVRSLSALQDILEKSVRELGAIRLIDSRIGVPGQLARNPRVILGRFRTTIRFASLQIRVLLVNLRLYSIPSDIHRTSGSARSSLLLDSEHRRCWVSWCCFRSSPSDAAEHSGKKRSRTRSN